jgi:hypothetical protein
MKGDVGTYFSVLDKRIKAWETERWLITPADFVECFTEAAAERLAPGLQEHFIDYLPSMTRQDFKQQCPLIQRRSLPSIMTATHSWHLQPLDIRRKSCLLKTIDMNLCLLTPVVENIVIYSFFIQSM